MSNHQALHHRLFLHSALILVGVLMVTAAVPADAQMTDRRWEMGFAVGSANLSSSAEDFDLDFRTELRGGYIFTDNFELELQLIRADSIFDAYLSAAMLNGVFSLRPDKQVVPYVLVGAGHYDLEESNFLVIGPEIGEDSSAVQAGIGTRFFVGSERRMAIRLELSSLWIDSDLFDADRHTSLTTGLSWTFGRR